MTAKNIAETLTGHTGDGDGRTRWRTAAWVLAALVLLLPLVAMQFTDEVNWTLLDFVFAGVLLFGSLGAYEAATRTTSNIAYRAGVGVAIAGAFLLTWINAAVGITDSIADLAYLGVPLVGIIGAFLGRFRPAGMARALLATALVQALVGVIAVVAGLVPAHNAAVEILGLTGFFVVLFAGSAWLFWRSSPRRQSAPSTSQTPMDKRKIHTFLSALTVLIGAVLMTYMIYVESEPGAIPLLLIVLGIGWYFIARVRLRSDHP